jgi:hypothetical protein
MFRKERTREAFILLWSISRTRMFRRMIHRMIVLDDSFALTFGVD